MNVRLQNLPKAWLDPDDAPELSDEFFEKGDWRIGDRAVSRDEARVELEKRSGGTAGSVAKVSTTICIDADVLAAFQATGDGWQTRMNDVLREWLGSR